MSGTDVKYSHLRDGLTDEDGVTMEGPFEYTDRKMLVLNAPTKTRFCSRRMLCCSCVGAVIFLFVLVITIGIMNKQSRAVIMKYLPHQSDPQPWVVGNKTCEAFQNPGLTETEGTVVYSRIQGNEVPHMETGRLICPKDMVIVNGAKHALCIAGKWSTSLGSCRHLGGTWLRLVNSKNQSCYSSSKSCKSLGIRSGRPEIFHNGHWGTLCDDGLKQGHWHKVAIAETLCTQLGLNPAKSDVCGEACERAGEGRIHFNNLRCPAGKQDISYCDYNTKGISICTHDNDIGLKCGPDREEKMCVDTAKKCAYNGDSVCKDKWAYDGHRAHTHTGRKCQKWNSATPHDSKFKRWSHNFCRNPDGQDGPWCYTTEKGDRWELCFDSCFVDETQEKWDSGVEIETDYEAKEEEAMRQEEEVARVEDELDEDAFPDEDYVDYDDTPVDPDQELRVCNIERGVEYQGHELRQQPNLKTQTVAECCHHCHESLKCNFWTWNSKTFHCSLKFSNRGLVERQGHISRSIAGDDTQKERRDVLRSQYAQLHKTCKLLCKSLINMSLCEFCKDKLGTDTETPLLPPTPFTLDLEHVIYQCYDACSHPVYTPYCMHCHVRQIVVRGSKGQDA